MPDVHQESCPLCAQIASYELIDAGKRKWFRCNNCKNFIITDSAEKHIASSPHLRKQLSQKSSSLPDDKLLHIFVPDSSSGDRGDQEALRAEIELKSTWFQRST
jgi:hypothetical protein